MLDKERVKELYLQGHNAAGIAIILNCKQDTVRQCIHRNFKEFKKSHLTNKIMNKEIDRITRHEVKRYMSDETFVRKNGSIYKVNSDGDLIIDVNIAPIVSFDTPKRLKNENSLIEIDKRISKSNYKKDELFV
jgi:hypothetical protein